MSQLMVLLLLTAVGIAVRMRLFVQKNTVEKVLRGHSATFSIVSEQPVTWKHSLLYSLFILSSPQPLVRLRHWF